MPRSERRAFHTKESRDPEGRNERGSLKNSKKAQEASRWCEKREVVGAKAGEVKQTLGWHWEKKMDTWAQTQFAGRVPSTLQWL